MTLIKHNTSPLRTQENAIHKALKAWYLTPGIQRDLPHKENGAVQTVLEVLERRPGVSEGADMSHQRQMEWRGYQRLGVAVIASAVKDLKKPTRAGKESGWAGESARAFLTVSNPNLKFWCGVADFDMNAILRKYWPDAGPS